MEQTERVFKLMEEFKDSLNSQFGDYTTDVEVIDGSKKVVLTEKSGDRHIMVIVFTKEGVSLVAVPEGEEMGPDLTQLERELLQQAGHRAAHTLQKKFSDRTGWGLSSYSAILQKGMSSIILEWEDGEISITEAEVEFSPSEED